MGAQLTSDRSHAVEPNENDRILFSEKFLNDPEAQHTHWRDHEPLWWSAQLHGHVVSRYDDVRNVLTNTSRYGQSEFFEGAVFDSVGLRVLVQMNPPEHGEYRHQRGATYKNYFLPKNIATAMGTTVEEIVKGVLDALATGEEVEVNKAISTPIAVTTIGRLLGIDDPWPVKAQLQIIAEYVKRARMNDLAPEVAASGQAAGESIRAYLRELRAAKLADPGPDLMSSMSATMAEPDVVMFAALTLIAGMETTVRALTNALYCLLSQPESAEIVRSSPVRAGDAFEETLRWMTPNILKARQVVADHELYGQQLREGDRMFVLMAAADRDPDQYVDPNTFQIDRAVRNHIAFGSGAHFCIGAPLARIVGRTLLRDFLVRFPTAQVARREEISFDGPVHRSPKDLWIRV